MADTPGAMNDSPDQDLLPYLSAGEELLAPARRAVLEQYPDETGRGPVPGRLYLTTRRLLHLDDDPISLPLSEIKELEMIIGLLLVTLAGGRGVVIRVEDAALVRSQAASAMIRARG